MTSSEVAAVEASLESGAAHAALASDLAPAEVQRLHGSPTIVLNEDRQARYGNVGYLVMEANIRELLRTRDTENASGC
jgi:predicted DsbA family dithiol-disulfide isomerase